MHIPRKRFIARETGTQASKGYRVSVGAIAAYRSRWEIPPRGVEQPHNPSKKTPGSETGGAESGAQRAPNGPIDPQLKQVIDAWSNLPQAVKAGILAMIDATQAKRGKP